MSDLKDLQKQLEDQVVINQQQAEELEKQATLIEAGSKENDELRVELEKLKQLIPETPPEEPQKPKIKKTCLNCRILERMDKKNGTCPKRKIPIDLKKPEKDCDYWRKPLGL